MARVVADWLSEDGSATHRIRVAGEFQHHLGRMLLALVSDIRSAVDNKFLCIGGGLFYHAYFTTLIQQSRLFEDLFVEPNPGNAGVAVGVALTASGVNSEPNRVVSPFLGPEYSLEDIKLTLDDFKLSCECLSETQIIEATVDARTSERSFGRMVSGPDGVGHLALGNRSILGSPHLLTYSIISTLS